MNVCLDIIVSPMEKFVYSAQKFLPVLLIILLVVIAAAVIVRRKRK